MKLYTRILMIAILVSTGWGGDSKEPAASKTWAVVVSGVNKDPDEKQFKAQAILRLKLHLYENFEIPRERVFALTSKDSLAYEEGMNESTSTQIIKTLDQLAEQINPDDLFIFYYVGQANVVKDTLRLNLPGKDLSHELLVSKLNLIKAKQSLIVLDCPAAGLAIKPLVKEGRIIIAGAQANQPWSTRFSQYFVPAMSDVRADYNLDEKVSLSEAFRYTVMQLDDYYRQRDLIKTENPLLEDDGDGVPSQQPWTREKNKDGRLADEMITYKI